ncbi:extracellular solute-binding protein [Picosynechococcus sp. NKBG15041c]|uniref:extracellular solute-binding protein n=1 Tax=Picosynechococcus sp. NKBG15041c TaxID=1407650 RepID=UPI0004123B33|nr:extracellular solute-binding protein [Picosynechococcus sp. NKBG15041c]
MKKYLKFFAILLISAVLAIACQMDQSSQKVVVYVSVDRVYAEPILAAFAAETGIEVLPVYDVEATKTTGLAQRLLREKERPQADVFWSGEFAQTLLLQDQGVLAAYQSPIAENLPPQYRDPEGYWTGIGGRARVLLVNTDRLAIARAPRSLADLASEQWPGSEVAIAYPFFGTTATHAAALYTAWEPETARDFFVALKQKNVQVVDGNSVVRDWVVEGRVSIGLTDTDDACSAVEKGDPVALVFPDQGPGEIGTFVLTGTVALVAGGPNPETGKELVDFLVSPETEQRLMTGGGSQLSLYPGATPSSCLAGQTIQGMTVNLEAIYDQLEPSKNDLSEIFIR